ncbi:MAG: response regulator transcription factor [Verrucomicrobiae bacterium]|nr:response regulator transcription factor [Verrucomicrobiae bacterium]
MNPAKRILIIDDERAIRKLLQVTLTGFGFEVLEAEDGPRGLLEAAHLKPDALLLDLGLPGMDGLEVLRRFREWSQIPVIILSVKGEEETKIEALNAGADDYLTKPFSSNELAARLHAVMRRSSGPVSPEKFEWGPLSIDFAGKVVRKAGIILDLTPTEYHLLRILTQNAGRVMTHRQILREIWGPKGESQMPHLRVHITHLRRKIENDPSHPTLIITDSGIGYRFEGIES